jgi:hypothetical protein
MELIESTKRNQRKLILNYSKVLIFIRYITLTKDIIILIHSK